MEFFLKSFIFALGDDWTEVNKLATKFKDYLRLINEKDTLNAAQASDFLQKQVCAYCCTSVYTAHKGACACTVRARSCCCIMGTLGSGVFCWIHM